MKKIEVFNPTVCCPTGLCGININPELMRIVVVTETLEKQGTIVARRNSCSGPRVHVSNKTVDEHLRKYRADALPVTSVDGEIAVSKIYPTTKQMSEWMGINSDFIPVKRIFIG